MVRKPSILLLGSESATRTASLQLDEFGCDVRVASKVSEAAGLCLRAHPRTDHISNRCSLMNLYARVFQDLEEGLYVPFPEDYLTWEEDDIEELSEEYVLA